MTKEVTIMKSLSIAVALLATTMSVAFAEVPSAQLNVTNVKGSPVDVTCSNYVGTKHFKLKEGAMPAKIALFKNSAGAVVQCTFSVNSDGK